ncbi:MAG: hypothetical protein K0S74_561 [Chlamydiales bacterium]|jgi:hypothetical protein|nr:hypothetical protein [Chlamydiales bacterium]
MKIDQYLGHSYYKGAFLLEEIDIIDGKHLSCGNTASRVMVWHADARSNKPQRITWTDQDGRNHTKEITKLTIDRLVSKDNQKSEDLVVISADKKKLRFSLKKDHKLKSEKILNIKIAPIESAQRQKDLEESSDIEKKDSDNTFKLGTQGQSDTEEHAMFELYKIK